MTVRFRRSIVFVPAPFSLSTSASLPTATMRCPLIATACAIVKRSSTVTILPLKRTMSSATARKLPASVVQNARAVMAERFPIVLPRTPGVLGGKATRNGRKDRRRQNQRGAWRDDRDDGRKRGVGGNPRGSDGATV